MSRLQKRAVVLELYNAGKPATEIFSMLRHSGYCRRTIYDTIRRYHGVPSTADKQRSGRPRTVRTPALMKKLRQRIHRNPQRSQRKLAREMAVSRSSIQRSLVDDLGLFPFRKRRVHGLPERNRLQRKERCGQLLLRHGPGDSQKICFSDEKLFQLEEFHNPQNKRVYALRIEDIPEEIRTVQRSQKCGGVMVWAAVSYEGLSPLVVLDEGVRINQQVYREKILEPYVKPLTQSMFHGGHWCFQQDSAPAHKAKSTQVWCQANLPSFISTQEWPSKSPDLNPLDYFVWGRLQESVNETFHKTRADLIRSIHREWARFPLEEVRAAINKWRPRLHACVKAHGGYFEI